MPDEAFWAGRLEILTELLTGNIFHTTRGFKLEKAARANVEAECADLEARLEAAVAGS